MNETDRRFHANDCARIDGADVPCSCGIVPEREPETYMETIRENMERVRDERIPFQRFGQDWEPGWLLVARRHFADSEGFEAGTEIKVREYDRDPSYCEIQLPNGTIFVESPDLIATYRPISDRQQREEFNEQETERVRDWVHAKVYGDQVPADSQRERNERNAIRERENRERAEREWRAYCECEPGKPCEDCGFIPEGFPNAEKIPECWKNVNMIDCGMIESSESIECCENMIRLPNDSGKPVICTTCYSVFERKNPDGSTRAEIVPEGSENDPEDWERGWERVSESDRNMEPVRANPGFEPNGSGGFEAGIPFAHSLSCCCDSCLGIDY